jgi:hypothetical protein
MALSLWRTVMGGLRHSMIDTKAVLGGCSGARNYFWYLDGLIVLQVRSCVWLSIKVMHNGCRFIWIKDGYWRHHWEAACLE